MKRENQGLTSVPIGSHTSPDPALQQHIAERAYQLFQMRGGTHGNHEQDWLRAEREITAAWGRKRTTTGPNDTTNGRSRTRTGKRAA